MLYEGVRLCVQIFGNQVPVLLTLFKDTMMLIRKGIRDPGLTSNIVLTTISKQAGTPYTNYLKELLAKEVEAENTKFHNCIDNIVTKIRQDDVTAFTSQEEILRKFNPEIVTCPIEQVGKLLWALKEVYPCAADISDVTISLISDLKDEVDTARKHLAFLDHSLETLLHQFVRHSERDNVNACEAAIIAGTIFYLFC